MTEKQQAKLVNDITDQLFTNGHGEKAKRLVLELEDGRDGGGIIAGGHRARVGDVRRL